jgi:hypothetical protein
MSYVSALLASPGYTGLFFAELETPGPRVPLTADAELFDRTVRLGEELLFLHTFGLRYNGAPARRLPHGNARATLAVSQDPQHYPNEFVYDEAAQELRVGDGVFAPVEAKVWAYEVSGLHVVSSWLDFRMRDRGGRKSSPLDDIRPYEWSPAYTEELLQLLWILERMVALEPEQDALLRKIIAGPLLNVAGLPEISDEASNPPLMTFPGQGALFVPAGEQPQLDQNA